MKVGQFEDNDNALEHQEHDRQLTDELNRLHKEFNDQEKLIMNYQRENEKLYLETKSLKKEMETIRNEFMEEKQKLSTELLTK